MEESRVRCVCLLFYTSLHVAVYARAVCHCVINVLMEYDSVQVSSGACNYSLITRLSTERGRGVWDLSLRSLGDTIMN